MSKNDPVLYTFHGAKTPDGRPREYLPGIPTRSLTQSDVDRLTRKGVFEQVEGSPLYRAVKQTGERAAKSATTATADAPADAGKEG